MRRATRGTLLRALVTYVTPVVTDTVAPEITVVEVTSNEPDSGLNFEDVPGDIEIVDGNTIRLRQERDEDGPGRVYTVVAQCSDSTGGNSARREISIAVPHDLAM